MLKETTLYTAICDRCEKDLMDAYARPFKTEKELQAGLIIERWHDTGELHFCPGCYTIDENDEIKLKPPIEPEPPTWEHRDAWSGGFADNH